MHPAPVLLFTYKRLDQTRQAVTALQQNFLAPESELFIFSDGPKTENDAPAVQSVRKYISTIRGFKKVTVLEAVKNKGLAASIIDGVTQLIDKYGQVIVLEDDLVPSRNFLSFSNQALQYYKYDPQVFSIGGYSRPIKGLPLNGTYVTTRGTSWGWATWKDRWNAIDWSVKDYPRFEKDRKIRRQFNQMGSDLSQMLDKQMHGKINSWAIRWVYHQFKNRQFTVFPATSKIDNIGFGEAASNTVGKFNKFATELDNTDTTEFIFSDDLAMDPAVVRQFVKPYTLRTRIQNKILNALPFF